jgi:SM-20-related protein
VSTSADLRDRGISIRDHFISGAEVQALIDCARARLARGDFVAARVGSQGKAQRREEIRGDFTCWLREPLFPAELALFELLDVLRLELNREATLGLFDLELHYAQYPSGAGYARHVDQPQGTTRRRVSLVLYLNADWEPQHGGVLRIHESDSQALDIEPVAGRLVCFLTPGREHEVLPARHERLSISGWFRARD